MDHESGTQVYRTKSENLTEAVLAITGPITAEDGGPLIRPPLQSVHEESDGTRTVAEVVVTRMNEGDVSGSIARHAEHLKRLHAERPIFGTLGDLAVCVGMNSKDRALVSAVFRRGTTQELADAERDRLESGFRE